MKEQTVPTAERTPAAEAREDTRYLRPPVDIFEKENDLIVVADLPGVDKADVDVRVEDNVLTISAKSKNVLPIDPHYREYELLNYHRQFELSDKVDQEQIKAELTNGVLVLTLPKKEEAKPRKIEVKLD